MILKILAAEDIKAGDPVALISQDNRQLYCQRTSSADLKDAIAARKILKDEVLTLNTGADTEDLLRRHQSAPNGLVSAS